MLKKILIVIGILVLGFVVIQLVPYGRSHANPPVTAQVQWDSPQTAAYFKRACADCHSNETTWPWYSNIAPVSWLVQHDVDEGREKFNISEPGGGNDEAAEALQRGKMPPMQFYPTHPEAKLTDAEKAQFVQGLQATFGD